MSVIGMSSHLRFDGFQTLKSAYAPRRNGMPAGRFSNSTKNAASFQARGVIWIGSQKPGLSSPAGSVLNQKETVPLQFVSRYATFFAAWKKTMALALSWKESASPKRPWPWAVTIPFVGKPGRAFARLFMAGAW